MRDAQPMLLRALRRRVDPPPVLRSAHSEAWASATFVGARHRFTFEPMEEVRADSLGDAITEAEFDLAGHLVADIGISSRLLDADGVTLTIEALTVEEG